MAASHKPKRSDKKTKRKIGQLSPFQKAVVIFFAVVFIVFTGFSTVLPLLQQNVANERRQDLADQQNSADVEKIQKSIDETNEHYQKYVDGLAQKADAGDRAALLARARARISWASMLKQSEAKLPDDKNTHQSDQHFHKAIADYDAYLKIDQSPAVKLDRARVYFLLEDETSARNALEALVKEHEDYAPAFELLAEMSEKDNNLEQAKSYYQSALNADPQDKYGIANLVQSQLSRIEMQEKSSQQNPAQGSNAAPADASAHNSDAAPSDATSDATGDATRATTDK